MRKNNLKLIAGAFAMAMGLMFIPSGRVNAAIGTSVTIKENKIVHLTQKDGKKISIKWTAPKAGYFDFSFENRTYVDKWGDDRTPYLQDVIVKLNGKTQMIDETDLRKRVDDDKILQCAKFNCDKGTRVEIIYGENLAGENFSPSEGTQTCDFKLNFKAPKNAIGLKNKSRKTATKVKLNKKYTGVAKRDNAVYGFRSNPLYGFETSRKKAQKASDYNNLFSSFTTFNKCAKNYDLDWFEFKAPKAGEYLFIRPRSMKCVITDSKGKAFRAGRGNGTANDDELLKSNIFLAKGEKVYFVMIPAGRAHAESTFDRTSGYVYTFQVKKY